MRADGEEHRRELERRIWMRETAIWNSTVALAARRQEEEASARQREQEAAAARLAEDVRMAEQSARIAEDVKMAEQWRLNTPVPPSARLPAQSLDQCDIPHVDFLIVGSSCKDLSSFNTPVPPSARSPAHSWTTGVLDHPPLWTGNGWAFAGYLIPPPPTSTHDHPRGTRFIGSWRCKGCDQVVPGWTVAQILAEINRLREAGDQRGVANILFTDVFGLSTSNKS